MSDKSLNQLYMHDCVCEHAACGRRFKVRMFTIDFTSLLNELLFIVNLLQFIKSEELAKRLMRADPPTRLIVRCKPGVIVCVIEVHILVHSSRREL